MCQNPHHSLLQVDEPKTSGTSSTTPAASHTCTANISPLDSGTDGASTAVAVTAVSLKSS